MLSWFSKIFHNEVKRSFLLSQTETQPSIIQVNSRKYCHFLKEFEEFVRGINSIGVPARDFKALSEKGINQFPDLELRLTEPSNDDPLTNSIAYIHLQSPGDDSAKIHGIYAHPPGEKIGTHLMKLLTETADKYGLGLHINSVPQGESVESRDEWLAKFGFKHAGGHWRYRKSNGMGAGVRLKS